MIPEIEEKKFELIFDSEQPQWKKIPKLRFFEYQPSPKDLTDFSAKNSPRKIPMAPFDSLYTVSFDFYSIKSLTMGFQCFV